VANFFLSVQNFWNDNMDKNPDTLFPYNPLAPDAFRVLECEASTQHELNFKLVEYPDENFPEYFALSYCWGTDPAADSITCDGRSFKVTTHLKEALRNIFQNHACTRLWVDAICIDQSSNGEKAVQVSKMHRIYHKAGGVFVWLGKSEENSDEAVDAINSVEYKPDSGKKLHERIINLKSDAAFELDVALFHPLAALSRRPWFRRLWIAQEYFFAKSVVFLCGSKSIEDPVFTRFLNHLSINSFGGHEPPGVQDEEALFLGFHALIELRKLKVKSNSGKEISFFDFVMEGRERFVKEPVDRVYGAFGMAESTDRVYTKGIPIDYSERAMMEYWNVYIEFSKIALQYEPQLRLLNHVSSRERPERLPSWCPNLNSRRRTSLLNDLSTYRAGTQWEHHDKTQCKGHPHYQGNETSHIMIPADSSTISIWGVKLGRIEIIGPTCDWDDNIDTENLKEAQELAKGMLEWIKQCEELCRNPESPVPPPRMLFNRLLVGEGNKARRKPINRDTMWDEEEAIENAGTTGEANSNSTKQTPSGASKEREEEPSVYNFLKISLGEVLEIDPETNWEETHPKLFKDFNVIYTWIMFIHTDWDGRVLFKTDSGLFGYASEDTVIGDHVCVFYGGGMAHILRDAAQDYHFVSDAFVLDFMDGETFEMLDESILTESLFYIS
jgi:heterokaryon incompatibility protein (HET)